MPPRYSSWTASQQCIEVYSCAVAKWFHRRRMLLVRSTTLVQTEIVLKNSKMDCREVLFRHSLALERGQMTSVIQWPFIWHHRQFFYSTSRRWITVTFGTEIHVSQMPYPNKFEDLLSFSSSINIWIWVNRLCNNWMDYHETLSRCSYSQQDELQ